jgi:FkbM family methyltransferase
MIATEAKRAARRLLRSIGFDVIRFGPQGTTLPMHLATLLPRLGIDTVVDVGAHWGEFGRLVRDSGFRGRIISFEPASANVERLNRVASGDPDWLVRPEALGRTDQTLEMNVTRQTLFNSFRRPLETALGQFPGATVQGHETVTIRRLDAVLDDCLPGTSSRVYLKLDTQGWDLEVMAGAAGCLGRIHGMQTEVSMRPIYEGMPGYVESITMLEGLGYTLTGLFAVSRDSHLRVVEMDCVMARVDEMAFA